MAGKTQGRLVDISNDVTVFIRDKDRRVGAMAKALAFEVGGPTAVVGASKGFLEEHGCYRFHFKTEAAALEFREAVADYLPGTLAKCRES